MNKSELVNAISTKVEDVTKADIEKTLNAALEAIKTSVAGGDSVRLIGFGTFAPKERKSREGRNPKTGEKITIPASVVPSFSAGKEFKEAVKK